MGLGLLGLAHTGLLGRQVRRLEGQVVGCLDHLLQVLLVNVQLPSNTTFSAGITNVVPEMSIVGCVQPLKDHVPATPPWAVSVVFNDCGVATLALAIQGSSLVVTSSTLWVAGKSPTCVYDMVYICGSHTHVSAWIAPLKFLINWKPPAK